MWRLLLKNSVVKLGIGLDNLFLPLLLFKSFLFRLINLFSWNKKKQHFIFYQYSLCWIFDHSLVPDLWGPTLVLEASALVNPKGVLWGWGSGLWTGVQSYWSRKRPNPNCFDDPVLLVSAYREILFVTAEFSLHASPVTMCFKDQLQSFFELFRNFLSGL